MVTGGGPIRRPNPSPRAERTRDPAPSEPGRPSLVRPRAAPCVSGSGRRASDRPCPARRRAERTRAPAPSEPKTWHRPNNDSPPTRPGPRRRANPSVRPSFAPVRLRASRGRGIGPRTARDRPVAAPSGPEPRRRGNPRPVAPSRTRASASGSPRCGFVRNRAGDARHRTARDRLVKDHPLLSRIQTRAFSGSSAGRETAPTPGGSGPGGRASNRPTTIPEPRSSTEQPALPEENHAAMILIRQPVSLTEGEPIRSVHAPGPAGPPIEYSRCRPEFGDSDLPSIVRIRRPRDGDCHGFAGRQDLAREQVSWCPLRHHADREHRTPCG